MFFDLLGGAFIALGMLLVTDFMGVAARFHSLGLRMTRWSYGNSPVGDFFERISPPWIYRVAGIGYIGMGIALIVTAPSK